MRTALLLLLLLMALQVRATEPTPLVTLFRRADTIVVGSIESISRTTDADIVAKMAPQEPLGTQEGVPASPCKITVRVAAVLKSQDGEIKEGTSRPVIWFTPGVIPCNGGSLGFDNEVAAPRLWLLRTENGILRYVVDRDESYRRLRTFSPEIKTEMEKWKDPALEVEYLLLKPGVRAEESGYARYASDEGMSLVVGSANRLKMLRDFYLESNGHMRDQISLSVASSGQCLNSARRAAKADGHLDDWVHRASLLDPATERAAEDVQLRQMQWTSKEQVLASYKNLADDIGGTVTEVAVDDLTSLACKSMPRVRARARQVLQEFFGIDPSSLPCIPCE